MRDRFGGLGLGRGAGLAVEADLRLDVTAPNGESTTAHVTGNGSQVRVEAARPAVLFASVDRADVGRVADLLAFSGVTVSVIGPGGPVATLGAIAPSRVGRAVTGSAQVSPVAGAALLVMTPTRLRLAALAVPVLAVVLTVVRRWRRS